MANGLSTFKVDDGIKDAGVSLVSQWKASDEWSVFGVIGYKLLLDDASDSPFIDVEGDENQFFGGVIVAYTF